MDVGVVSIQGDFDKHLEALARCSISARKVRSAEDLAFVDRLILPGGESTTVGLLMQRFGLGAAIQDAAKKGMPIWGTCMGMILMAKTILGRPHQWSLGLLDVEIERNAFGAQVHSFEDEVQLTGFERPTTGVFIRAPVVTKLGHGVVSLAEYQGKTVAVRQGNRVGTSFHPELTSDLSVHKWFARLGTEPFQGS